MVPRGVSVRALAVMVTLLDRRACTSGRQRNARVRGSVMSFDCSAMIDVTSHSFGTKKNW